MCLLIAGVLSGFASAQEKAKSMPVFSGTWILDESASEDFGKFMNGKKAKIVIEHSDPQIEVVETVVYEQIDRKGKRTTKKEETVEKVFFTDKRGEKNTTSRKTEKSVTR